MSASVQRGVVTAAVLGAAGWASAEAAHNPNSTLAVSACSSRHVTLSPKVRTQYSIQRSGYGFFDAGTCRSPWKALPTSGLASDCATWHITQA